MNAAAQVSGPIPESDAILHSRSEQARSVNQLAEERIKHQLVSGARALEQITTSAVLKARIAVTLLQQLADDALKDLRPAALGRVWSESSRRECAEAVATFKSAFSLQGELLQGFRERDPDFVFRYLLMRGLFYGRLPVCASDMKDTLVTFVESKGAEPDSPQRRGAGFKGVREAIESAVKTGPFFVVTGDKHETVVKEFLSPNRWVKQAADLLVPAAQSFQNLVWLPRTGMEIVRFDQELHGYARSPLVKGITEREVPELRNLLQRIYADMKVPEHFSAPGRCYPYRPEAPPGFIEPRPGDDGTYSISFFPAGILQRSARASFKADHANAPFMEAIVSRLNAELQAMESGHVLAKRGGLSTVDLVTSDKGIALSRMRREFCRNNELLVFLGDKIALNGNDVEGSEEADVSIQVGFEWEPSRFPLGNRMLLRSKQIASEGGSAEYINALTEIRRLGLTGILAPEENGRKTLHKLDVTPRAAVPEQLLMPVVENTVLDYIIAEVRGHCDQLLSPAGGMSETKRRATARLLENALARVPDTDSYFTDRPLVRLETQLLKRVVAGQTPVLASDLKDTLAVFDADGFEWFPDAKEKFIEALRSGGYFLMTGDSLPNLKNRFLVPAAIIEMDNGHLKSDLPGIHNLHLITRTGLDRVTFNFAKGELERSPLVTGINVRDIAPIQGILSQATDLFHCGDVFERFPHESGRGRGFIEVRGEDFGDNAVSFAYFPAGVLLRSSRPEFREIMTDRSIFRAMAAHIRKELQTVCLDSVIVQQGGISTLDLTTSTKGSALAQLRRELLAPHEFVVFIGDTVTHNGNDGSTVGVADITVQVGAERDPSLAPPPGHQHIHSPVHARQGGAALVIDLALRARKLARTALWERALQ